MRAISVVAGARNHLPANRPLGFSFEIVIWRPPGAVRLWNHAAGRVAAARGANRTRADEGGRSTGSPMLWGKRTPGR